MHRESIGRAALDGEAERGHMGSVIVFPDSRRAMRIGSRTAQPETSAEVVILPVIRIERYADVASDGVSDDSRRSGGGGKRRRRAARS